MSHSGRAAFALLILAIASLSVSAGADVATSYANLPLHFERNEGQTDSRVQFVARGKGYQLFLTRGEAVLTLRRTVVRARLVGSRLDAEAAGEEPLPGRSNFFIGNDPSKWRTGVPQFGRVRYRDVWPGIDLTYRGTDQRQLEYDFVVAPGADPGLIRFEFRGIESMSIDKAGNLVLHTASGDLVEYAPVIYQPSGNGCTAVEGRFVLLPKHRVGFAIAKFDRSLPLVIDPTLAYSTYLGGNGDDYAYGIAVDASGNAYVTGYTTSTNFPTQGAYQSDQTGDDVFVTKLSAAGNSLVYSTYIGGSGNDSANAIAVDSAGCVYITGKTASSDFPTASSYQSYAGSQDAFVTKLSASGAALTYSTYLGGSSTDEALGIAVDASGNAYVTGSTDSTNFPTTAGAYQTDQTSTDAFVTKLSASGDPLVLSLSYSTYLGGSSSDGARAIAVDGSGSAYVTGYTDSSNFPTTTGAFQTTDPPWRDAFVTKLAADGGSLAYSTYLGGNNNTESGWAIAVNAAGNAFVAGETNSTNFPTVNSYQTYQWMTDGFVTKLSTDGSALVYSTYLGGSSDDSIRGIAINQNGDAYVAGYTYSSGFPTLSPFQTYAGNVDAFVTRLSASGNSLVYSTYLGGSSYDYACAIALDATGNAYVAGYTGSSNFPAQGPYQTYQTGYDGFVAKLSQRLSIADRAVAEGNSGTTAAEFTVSLDGSSSGTVTVDYTTANGSATAGSDYQSASGTVTFLPGEITKTITVSINGDTDPEQDETYTVTLSNASGAVIGRAQATGMILDDDAPPPVLNISDISVAEGNSGTILSSVPVTLSYARGVAVTVDYQTTSGTATTPGDYTATSGTLTFPPGTTSSNIVVSTAGDTLVEGRETFSVTLSNPTHAVLGKQAGVVTINDDDAPSSRTGDLAYDRNGHTATLLPDGRVLVVSSGTAEIFDPAKGTWSITTPPPVSQTGHAAAVLPSGKAMVAGGTAVSIFDPTTSLWTSAPALTESRSGHTMTSLNDGRVLIAGGYDRTSAETYVESGGGWTHVLLPGNPTPARTEHTATRLSDGRVLVVGGWVSSGNSLKLATIFNPADNTWTPAGELTAGRHSHIAMLLPDGRVLVAGGFTSWSATSWTPTCEIWNPATNTWSSTGSMLTDRATAVAALLGTGEVFIGGGNFADYTDMEVYSPALGLWISAGKFLIARRGATATLLTDGRVLIVGGNGAQEESKGFTAEVVDPSAPLTRASSPLNAGRRQHTATLLTNGDVLVVGGGNASYEIYHRTDAGGTWTLTAEPSANRRGQTATLLPNGSVLVAGGGTSDSDGSNYAGLFSLVSGQGTWAATAAMNMARRGHTATLLSDGRVLVAGGASTWTTSSAEIFNGSSWVSAGNMATGRWRHTATRLSSGEVLVTGGQSTSISEYLRSAEIYDPRTSTWRPAASMGSRRTGHVAVALRDGRVLVVGGEESFCTPLATAEVYDPARDVWTPVASMARGRINATATLLWNGKVVVAGGEGCLDEMNDVEIWDPVADRWVAAQWSLTGRFSHTATLLTTGEILFTGGEETTIPPPPFADTVLFDPNGFDRSRAPEITSATTSVAYGVPLTISGNRLRSLMEAASGATESSASDLPVVEMRSVEGGRVISVARDAIGNPTSSITVSHLPDNLDAGWHFLRVVTAGVASQSVLVNMTCSVNIDSVSGPVSAVSLGAPATFTVQADGARTYQWQRCITATCAQESEWTDIPGATAATYTTAPVTGADAGTKFRVALTGNCASQTSSAMLLTVADAAPPSAAVVYPTGGEYWLLSPTDGNPPNTKVVTWSMSDDVRVCRVDVALLYSDDGGASYSVAQASGGLPASFGPGANCVYPGESTKSLTYTIPTTFPSLHSGSLYKIRVTVTDEANNSTTVTSPNPFYIVQPNPDSVKTLIIWNRARMIARQGVTTTQADQIGGKLQELANHPRVLGLVVDLSGVTSIASLYATWDGEPANSTKANSVLFGTGGIHEYLLTNLLSAYSGVKYLVLVGDDRIIPMARVQDRTTLLPETTYAGSTDLSETATTAGQALWANKYLSDDPLAVLDTVPASQLDGSVYIPDLAVGRLVETPSEIVTTIATYISQDGILDLSLLNAATGHKVLITGYDFLTNVATQMRARWKASLGDASGDSSTAPVDGTLISATWGYGSVSQRAAALKTKLGGNGGPRYGIMAIAGHATHYEEGVPGTSPFDIQGLPASDIATLDLSGGVVYAVGCHGGLPVAETEPSHAIDLPQTMLGRGAVAYVANSGYGWSLKYGIGYGGRLVQIFTEEMTSGGTIAVGDAVRQSKQRYFLEAPRYDAYDEKTLMQWTLFGLPMYAVKTGIAAGAGEIATTGTLGTVRVKRNLTTNAAEGTRSAASLPAYLTQLNLSFDFTAPGVYRKHDSGGNVLPSGPGCPDPNGCYYTLNGLVDRGTGSGDLPIEPYLIYDSRLAGTSQHGVLWKGGTYDEESGWVPVIAELISNGGDGSDHGAAPRVIKIKPHAPRIVPGVDSPSCRPSDLEMNSLTIAAGEAVKPATNLTYSIARRYRTTDLEVFYFNNTTTPGENCDRTGPDLGAGPYGGAYHQVTNGSGSATINWSVPASDSAGVWRVVVVYNTNTVNGQAQGMWTPVELVSSGGGTFTGSVMVSGTAQLTYAIQAVDNRGNVTWLDFTTTQPPSSGVGLDVPQAVDVTIGAIAAPAGVIATAQTTTSVSVTWGVVTGAVSYDVYRKSSTADYTKAGSNTSPSFTDTVAPGMAYLYAVKAIDAGSNASALSAPDLATTFAFTDPTITPGSTPIRAVHITELRSAIAAVRALAGVGPYSYTDPTITPGVTVLKAAHITELRSALDGARSLLGIVPAAYSDPVLTPAMTVKAGHMSDLRNGVR